ncbi:MAG: MotA/TolQ/ExbB proton channel family protein [Myxococcota bacterium]|nr:MotA/TolQ/ExbB proton channel family protein [Myxococcota bacterium]
MTRLSSILAALILCLVCEPTALAQTPGTEAGTQQAPAKEGVESLRQLLERVRSGWRAERRDAERREARFRSKRDDQRRLLTETLATLAAEEARSERLESDFEANEVELARLEDMLQERLGVLGELFGVVRQVAGDTRSNVETSLVSAQLPGRAPFLESLGQSKRLPSIESLEKLWYTLAEEMTELGRVVRFVTTVVRADGNEAQQEVIRVGAFNAVSNGVYLAWQPETEKLTELARQPAGSYLASVESFEAETSGMPGFALDPSRGSILAMLVQTPSAGERIAQGGIVGAVILCLGALGGALAIYRWVIVTAAARKVAAQKESPRPDPGNPLGRVLASYEENRDVDVETLELKLDEAILRESSQLEKFLWALKVVGVVAPLLGLLGTVTGMIRTFQLITLFGTGDPKMMASGISEALVTTMLGLCVAIPMVLLHALVASSSRSIVDILNEQAAGLVARRAERDVAS